MGTTYDLVEALDGILGPGSSGNGSTSITSDDAERDDDFVE